MLKIISAILLSIITFFPTTTFAWWDVGHMAVAQIAYENLDDRVKTEVDSLSAEFGVCFPSSDTFITSACWADDISNQGLKAFFHWHGSAHPYDPCGILSREEEKKVLSELEGCDILWAMDECLLTLRNPEASPWAKGFMLRILVHIIGDLHQPLHCATLYSPAFPRGDRAGTRFPIQWGANGKSSLHSFWDAMCGLGCECLERPLTKEGRKHLDDFVSQITAAFPETSFPTLEEEDFAKWRQDSYDLAISVAYRGIAPDQKPSENYVRIGQDVSRRQAALAGYRLARLLNSCL